MLSHIDSKGKYFLLLKEINDQCKDASEINRAKGFMTRKSGNVHAKKTTRGLTLWVEWKGGYYKWVTLVDLKHSNTMELSGYTVANQFQENLRCNILARSNHFQSQDDILAEIHKFGIRIPKTVK